MSRVLDALMPTKSYVHVHLLSNLYFLKHMAAVFDMLLFFITLNVSCSVFSVRNGIQRNHNPINIEAYAPAHQHSTLNTYTYR